MVRADSPDALHSINNKQVTSASWESRGAEFDWYLRASSAKGEKVSELALRTYQDSLCSQAQTEALWVVVGSESLATPSHACAHFFPTHSASARSTTSLSIAASTTDDKSLITVGVNNCVTMATMPPDRAHRSFSPAVLRLKPSPPSFPFDQMFPSTVRTADLQVCVKPTSASAEPERTIPGRNQLHPKR
ncbi:hypothetical protein WMY93_032002 [Mugilogobius chulae]|uniref:Uncharacterized protein n=1 Tax=Mugilogobius chulae TaxID=88201 RepID=A0AAW0MEW4_9GOBI